MATSDPSCDICLNLHVTKSATVWCSECEEALCEECKQRHCIQKATKNHKTIQIEDYQELPIYIANIKLECEDHNRKLDFYCSIHNEPCCTRCVSEKHKDCRELKQLPEVVDGIKSSAAFSDLQDRVTDMSQVIGQLIKEKIDNKSNLQIQRTAVIAEVERVRKAINKHLDKIQDELLNMVRANEEQHRDNIDSMIGKLSKMKNDVDEIANALEKTKQHASNFQTFLGVNKWSREIETQEREVKTAHSDHSMDNVELLIKMSPLVEELEKNVSEFGKLVVTFSPRTKLVLWKEKQSQSLLITASKSISKIELSNLCSFDIPRGSSKCLITGCDMFEDERIVFADFTSVNKRLVVVNNEGLLIKEIKFEARPLDVAVLDSNTVAVTFFDEQIISIVDVGSSRIMRNIPVKEICFGICFIDGNLVVSMGNKIIKIIDLYGKVLSSVSKMAKSTYCTSCNDKIYYASEGNGVVYCCDLNGSVQWEFSCGKSDFPNGIAHDASGNVFVTCKNTNQVIVIESSGKKSRVLLTIDNGLNEPIAIHYNRKTDILLVCNKSGRCLMNKVMR
ncbi:unnamed protein product [Mytilus coruscus]|uniref:B box-type domain-containing protein n=1 Tax=Mytilus coruscus TaxID=42192 RepID=A0A6J7ZZ42_MYTCO|nr:unnamed protein product [Mytilus coruscus]